jgi:NifU-like protein involved in Fe-S cluster formation
VSALYNTAILRLAASIPHTARLESPHASVQRTSPVCGSRVTADVALDAQGRVAAFGQEVRACALGQASAAVLGRAILGQTADSLSATHDALASWLKNSGELPESLPDLALFEPARVHKGRHASILLPWATAAEAAQEAAALHASIGG